MASFFKSDCIVLRSLSIEFEYREVASAISDLSSLELDVVYNNAGLEETHSTVNKFQSFLTIFGLDTRNSNGDEVLDSSEDFYLGDGKIDNNTILGGSP